MVPTNVCFPLHEIFHWDCLYQVERTWQGREFYHKKRSNLQKMEFYYIRRTYMKRIFFTKKEVTYTENKIRKGNKNILAIVYDIIIITTF
jgi:hypothetical protein